MAVVELKLRTPLPHQRPALLAPTRFKVLCWGRRAGKTEGVGLTAVVDGHGPLVQGRPMFLGAVHGKRIWWVAKNSGVALLIWDVLRSTLRGVWSEKNETHRRIIFPTGGEITVKSGDEPDSLRGPGLDGLVIDEAAHQPEEVWSVMRPALADKQGWAIFISTPNYKRLGVWFRRLYDQVPATPGWYRERRPTADNPIIPPLEIEAARRAMAPLLFRQEFLAEFVEAQGAIFRAEWFRYYRSGEEGIWRIGEDGQSVAHSDGQRFGTVDLAASLKTSADYTVIASVQATSAKDLLVLDIDRRRIAGPDQIPAIERAIRAHRLGIVWIERTGYQLALVHAAIRQGLPVRELAADRDKLSRSMPLQARMAAGTVYFREGAAWLPDLEAELLSFSGEPDGRRQDGIEAEVDYHDDQVDALSYAAQIVGARVGGPQVLSLARG